LFVVAVQAEKSDKSKKEVGDKSKEGHEKLKEKDDEGLSNELGKLKVDDEKTTTVTAATAVEKNGSTSSDNDKQ